MPGAADLPGPWLVADIGGTNARFGLVTRPGGRPEGVRVLAGSDHPGVAEAALAYLAGRRPAAACLAVAAPIVDGRFTMNNAPWSGSAAEIGAALGTGRVELINDFEALALALPDLEPGDLRAVGGAGLPQGGGPMAVLGPGTGLGAALLVPSRHGWVPVPGEGGHAELAPVTDLEYELVRLLRAESGAAGGELLLSGAGLARIHRLLGRVTGVPAEPLTAEEITARAAEPACRETLLVFCALLGSFAGNAALTMGARGGVFLGGGILPRIQGILEASDFRARFEAKPPVHYYLRGIPTALIVAGTPALTGAAAHLAGLETLEYA